MKRVAVTVLLLIIAVGGYCMIETLSLEELASRSDVIALVDVVGVKAVGRLPSQVEVIANLVKVNEPFKGSVAGVQGWWPLDSAGKFSAMGTGKTIEDVKKAIENPPPPSPARPRLSL